MIGKGSEFLMSEAEVREKASAKWRSVKLVLMTSTVIIVFIPVALLPLVIRWVQPTAEFVLLVVAPGVWNSVSTWITAPCLYVLLNIILVTLGFISRAPPTSNDERSLNSGIINRLGVEIGSIETRSDIAYIDHNNIIVETNILADPVEEILSTTASLDQVQKPAAALIVECRSSSLKDLKATLMPAPALYKKDSKLRRSTVKLSNLSRESRESREMPISESCTPAAPKTSSPQLVVFEISTDMGDYYTHLNAKDEVAMVEGDEDSNLLHRREEEGMPLSSEELYAKAESFIGNFYRQLKIQREDSWNRLCGIYKRSC